MLRDVGRGTDLVDQGWRLYRSTGYEVLGDPGEVVAKIGRALGAREHTRRSPAGGGQR